MGYCAVFSPCGVCRQVFAANPVRVPSFRFDGVIKQPICRACMDIINARREAMGHPAFTVAADAYDAVEESEL